MQNQNTRGFWGVIIPVEILDSTELTITEKMIYGYIASYTKMCLDTNEKIAERLNVNEKTIRRALEQLQAMGYVYVEYLNNNPSKRRIYSVFENPKKLEYLANKGLFKRNPQSYPQPGQNVQGADNELGQNVQVPGQNVRPQNRGELGQNVQHRIIEEKEEGQTEQKPNGSAGSACEAASRPKRSDYENQDEYSEALYNWNTIGAH